MPKEVTCPPCGAVIGAESDEELIAAVQQHAKDDHNTDLSAEHILANARTT